MSTDGGQADDRGPRYRGPVPAPWGEADIERLSTLGDEARAAGAALWRREAPRRLRGLLDGPGPEDAGAAGDAGPG